MTTHVEIEYVDGTAKALDNIADVRAFEAGVISLAWEVGGKSYGRLIPTQQIKQINLEYDQKEDSDE